MGQKLKKFFKLKYVLFAFVFTGISFFFTFPLPYMTVKGLPLPYYSKSDIWIMNISAIENQLNNFIVVFFLIDVLLWFLIIKIILFLVHRCFRSLRGN